MEAWSAFVSIMSIVAIVVVAGGLIAFIGHMVIGVFDGKPSSKNRDKEVIDYSEYKQLEKGYSPQKEYNFEAINQSKAQREKEMLRNEKETFFDLDEDKDEELEEIENRLKSTEKTKTEEVKEIKQVKEVEQPVEDVVENTIEEDFDDFDLDNLLSEISNDVIEEEKSQVVDEEIKMSEKLSAYSIDNLFNETEEDLEDVEDELDNEEESQDVVEEEIEEVEDEIEEEIEELEDEEIDIFESMPEEKIETPKAVEQVNEVKRQEKVERIERRDVAQLEYRNSRDAEVAALKLQLEDLNKQLEDARNTRVEVVKIDTTEEECIARLEMLEERLKNVKKDYKINAKEYRPLRKVMNDLERYQTKLRRKEAVVAKKKVALYGVNNYVDIDKEKAEKLANELELLDGLRLSVSHCENVINANKDRFPVLEHTNQILEDQINHIEADIASTQAMLQKIRERNGNGSGSNGNK